MTIAEDDLRQYYEANAERFLHPEQTEVQEILVRTEIEALQLKGMIEDGAAFGDLAKRHSVRSLKVRDDEGRFHVHRYESPQFGGFVEAVVEAAIGGTHGTGQGAGGLLHFQGALPGNASARPSPKLR